MTDSTPDPLPEATVASLHPECPDVERLGPNRTEGLLRALATRVGLDRERRDGLWSHGFTRRRFLAGTGTAAAVSLADQLVTMRASFGATSSGTVVVIFLRGGMDGLSVVVPAGDPHLQAARPQIAVPAGALLPLDRGFGLHPALGPLHRLWQQGKLAAVPAVATPDLSRSHFQAQDCLERGGAGTVASEGWLDRVLDRLGSGTTFRAIGHGATLPRSLIGDQVALSVKTIDDFKLEIGNGMVRQTSDALQALYTGLGHQLEADVKSALSALEIATVLSVAAPAPAASYATDDKFAKGLSELARLIKSDVGVRVAAIDLGGWDHHAYIGDLDAGNMTSLLADFAAAMDAFVTDLGPKLDDVTIVTVSEFGRRIEENANNGADHGHGGVSLVIGGKVAGGRVHGNWPGLAPEVRDHGDVPGSNDVRNVLGEIVGRHLGLSADDLAAVFPGHRVQPVGVMR